MSGGPSRKALWKDILTCGVVILISGVTKGQDDPTTSTTPGKMFKISPMFIASKTIFGVVFVGRVCRKILGVEDEPLAIRNSKLCLSPFCEAEGFHHQLL